MENYKYINEDGVSVFTSEYLKNKKTCCKSKCLHCPYGYTVKMLGLKFEKLTEDRIDIAKKVIGLGEKTEFDVASSLLSSSFKKKTPTINLDDLDSYYFVTLKDTICAVVRKSGKQAKELFLKEQFKSQGLDLDLINSHDF